MTPAVRLLADAGIAHEVVAYAPDPRVASYGLAAAAAVGVEPERVFKTLLAELDHGELVVGCVPVTERLDLRALAAAAGAKRAAMASPRAAERSTGYVVGGISPLGQRRRLRSFVDESAELWETVHVSAGRRGLEVVLAPDDLLGLLGAVIADLTSRAR